MDKDLCHRQWGALCCGVNVAGQCSRLPGCPARRRHGSEHLQVAGEAEEAHSHFGIKPVKAL